MICTECNIKSVCKIYDLIRDKRISIDSCEFNSNKIITKKESLKKDIPIRKSRINNDLREIEKKELGIEEEKHNITNCPTCNGVCYDTSIKLCDGNCGNFICDNCGTSINGKSYCEKCYSKI